MKLIYDLIYAAMVVIAWPIANDWTVMLSVAMPMQCSRHCSKHVYHRSINTCAFRSAGAVCSDAAGAYLLEKRHSSHWISSSNNGAKKEALRPGPAVWKHVLHDDSCHDCPSSNSNNCQQCDVPSALGQVCLWKRSCCMKQHRWC